MQISRCESGQIIDAKGRRMHWFLGRGWGGVSGLESFWACRGDQSEVCIGSCGWMGVAFKSQLGMVNGKVSNQRCRERVSNIWDQ